MIEAAENKILAKFVTTESKVNGLFIPDSSRFNNQVEIVSIGNKVETTLKVGDIVIANYERAIKFPHAGQEYFVFSADDVLAIIT